MSSSKTYSHSLAYSDECATGDGNCDGFIPELNKDGWPDKYAHEECGCFCHKDYTFLPSSVQEVATMHREERELFGSVN